ncbi:MAG: DNA polymerase III subunit gamma/tau [Treponemataceae bacterium]|nr:DNA polymerase III subunit gamma/tau [Spirochaetales bacterium]MDY6031823.1 DNA polymerase III subunit gamma/tau [Treponemataceae bacterium]
MAYEVTATRRRPQRFEDLVGQEFVVATLKNAIQSGKIAHAYLFSGPRGCGKTSSARILAKALNCAHGPSATPCEECTSCKEITKGSSLDVIEIDGASNTGINDVRQIKDEIMFPPNSSRYKIYIIDEVHMLSTPAFNALLKTIEEPPEYAIFIFATTELHKVPATIKSRCQQFHFRLGSVEQIKGILEKAAQEIGVQAEDEALYWIARESTGSFRDAYTLFDQVVAFSDGHITYEKIRDKLGLVGVEALNEISEYCVDGNAKSALEKIDDLLSSGVSIEQFVSNYADYIRSLLLIESGIQKEALLGQNVERFSKKVLSSWNRVMLERALSLFLNLYRDIRYSLSPRYECELAVSRLCWLTKYVSAPEIKAAIDQAKNLLMQNTGTTVKNDAPPKKELHFPPIPRDEGKEGSERPFQSSGYQKKENSAPVTAILEEEQSSKFNSFYDTEIVRNNPSLSIEELKKEIIKELNSTDKLAASILYQTKGWYFENGVITADVLSLYAKNQVESRERQYSKLLSEIWGKNVKFVARIVETHTEKVPENIPDVIKGICESVRGEIVSVMASGEPEVKKAPVVAASADSDNDDSNSEETEENLEDGE